MADLNAYVSFKEKGLNQIVMNTTFHVLSMGCVPKPLVSASQRMKLHFHGLPQDGFRMAVKSTAVAYRNWRAGARLLLCVFLAPGGAPKTFWKMS